MLFSSNVFLFAFLPAVLLCCYLAPRPMRNGVLLVFSLFFYGWGEPVYLLLMLFTIVFNYLSGLLIARRRESGRSAKAILAAAIAGDLLLLGYFKYAGFLLGTAKALVPALSGLKVRDVVLPIGISFYIFQSMSYVIDLYRGDVTVQRSVFTFGTYVTLFPQLIAGPIVRYRDVAEQLERRHETVDAFASGTVLFILGLGKKLLLANPMGSLWNLMQADGGTFTGWIGIAAYSLQIYFDFSGYSDMARGLGRMLGFEFMLNFDYPYISRSITEFWRRWHISLSSWFREYVYIPLGGNRRGLPRQLVNILIVWMLTGLWHGASWNFVLWGLYYALLLMAEKLFLLKILDRLPGLFRHIYTLLAVALGWALFYFEDMGALFAFLSRLFGLSAASPAALAAAVSHLPYMLVCCFACLPTALIAAGRMKNPCLRWLPGLFAAVVLLLCVSALASQSYNPFIYFRF